MFRVVTLRLAAAASLSLLACDKTAPAVPYVDPVPTRTSLDGINITGVAEAKSTLLITRTPAFADPADVGAVTTWKADPVSGRFAFRVPLALNAGDVSTPNTIQIVSQDAKGNKSEPATMDVVREARRPEGLIIALGSASISADDGKLFVRVTATHHETTMPLAGLVVNVSVTGYTPAPAATTGTTDDAGNATIVLDGLTTAGTGKVVVEAAQAGPQGPARAEAPFVVHAGLPANVHLTLGATGMPAADTLSVAAGTDVQLVLDVKDAHQNAINNADITITSDLPGAVISGLSILGVQAAGTWLVTATGPSPAASDSATLTVRPGAPERMVMTLSSQTPQAGDTLTAEVRMYDAHGNLVSPDTPPMISTGLPVWHSGQPDQDAQAFAITTTAESTRGAVVPKTKGRFTATATSGLATASLQYEVLPGAPDPAGFSFDLGTIPAGGFLAGQPVPFTYSVLDSFQNETGHVIVITVNAPNAFIVDNGDGNGTVNGIVRAGSYTVRAVVPGTGIAAQTEPLILSPDPGQGFNLTLSASLAAQGGSILTFVQDAYGNQLDITGITFPGLDPTITQAGNRLSFAQQGSFAITACLAAVPTTCDTEYVGVQGSVDVTPPSVTVTVSYPQSPVTSVFTGGRVSFTVNSTDDRSLSQLSYVVQFGLGGSCTRAGGPLLLPAGTVTTTPPVAFTFTVPNCALPLDRISIVARAMDAAGNANNSAENTTLSVASQYNTTPTAGFVVNTLAYGNNLNQCTDAVMEASNGRVLVSNTGASRGMAIYADRTIATLQDNNAQTIDMQQSPRGVEYDSVNNRSLFAIDQANRIGSLDAAGTWNNTFITAAPGGIMFNGIPEGLAYDGGFLCIAFPASRTFQCINLGATPGQTAVSRCTTTDNTNLSQPAHIALRGTDIWVSDRGNNRLHHYTLGASTCTYVASITPAPAITQPADILIAPNTGNLLVTDRNNANGAGKLVRVTTAGAATNVATGFDTPNGLAWSGNGVLVVDEGRTINEAVFLVTPDPAAPGTF